MKKPIKIKIVPIYPSDKVKINIEMIQSISNYPKGLIPQYVEWIESNSEKEFIVKKNKYGMCELKDGFADVLWTFWEGHLIKV